MVTGWVMMRVIGVVIWGDLTSPLTPHPAAPVKVSAGVWRALSAAAAAEPDNTY